ncbi:protein ecdysoneless homolog [Planococcus citri]|uniref:protein ecdysoneless homolog n=1 Tax=Planococcus citri TaxID=170843 RepID=UPI0031F85B4C
MPDILETVRSDDFVEYFIYLINEDESAPTKLQDIRKTIFSSYAPLLENYIWHKDEFNLREIVQSTDTIPSHLHGIVHYGENIEDEWFIVYLLMKISSQFDDVIIKVVDSDGEFILIEAANYLPKWVKPENSADQVYIHKGSVKISRALLKNTTRSSSVRTIIDEITKSKDLLPIEKSISRCISDRIQKYDDGLNESLHRSRAYLPAKIAALLDAKPGLIAPAVTAFCQRDLIDTRICKKMETFPPDDMVLRMVTFTKFNYAMIARHKMYPEKKSAWKLPPSSSPNFKEYHLGYKIACGFEILASKCSDKSKTDLKLSKKWNLYVEVLNKKGYFKDLIEGSKEYVELKNKARIYFLDNVGIEEADENNLVMNFLQTITFDVDSMKQEESKLPLSDDEKWMEISEEEFNKLLEEKFGVRGVNVSDSPEALSNTINKFLNSASGVEGVEFKNDNNLNAMDVDENNHSVNFDDNEFVSSIEKMLDIMNLEQDKSADSDISDSVDSDDCESEENATGEDAVTKSYMDLMDKELQGTCLSQSFVKKSTNQKTNSKSSPDDINSVDIDMNALTNMGKSCEESGGCNPTRILLHSMGLKLD